METWKVIYNDALKAARGLHECLAVLVTVMDQGSVVARDGPKGEHVPAPVIVVERLWDWLTPRQRRYTRLVHGHCGGIRHAWIALELTEETLGMHHLDGAEVMECVQCLQLPVRWIIDPCALDVMPQVLLISPEAPARLLYKEMK